uniref:dUTPase-like domain-containing protein n=1 Tax=Palpitomonas bilix TaxID=652834 RepID=A0A7S3LTV3_9EUKA|mmetsp:Transcript_45609/g.117882  ORF Transcript_45609/g.117882 Transcript_45609/m.117882 type:complete len:384 (+) Transcript_45609:41-1192(+)
MFEGTWSVAAVDTLLQTFAETVKAPAQEGGKKMSARQAAKVVAESVEKTTGMHYTEAACLSKFNTLKRRRQSGRDIFLPSVENAEQEKRMLDNLDEAIAATTTKEERDQSRRVSVEGGEGEGEERGEGDDEESQLQKRRKTGKGRQRSDDAIAVSASGVVDEVRNVLSAAVSELNRVASVSRRLQRQQEGDTESALDAAVSTPVSPTGLAGSGAVLSKDEILKAIAIGEIKIEPFRESALSCASIDLTLADEFRYFPPARNVLHITDHIDYKAVTEKVIVPKGEAFVLSPGQTCLSITQEKITLSPRLCGILEGRSRFARLGLFIHITASFMNPGISNRQVLEIYNASNNTVALFPGTKICQFIFLRMAGEATYQGHFKAQEL